jgi:hypothetical protein
MGLARVPRRKGERWGLLTGHETCLKEADQYLADDETGETTGDALADGDDTLILSQAQHLSLGPVKWVKKKERREPIGPMKT